MLAARRGMIKLGVLYPAPLGGFAGHALAAAFLAPGLSRGIQQFKDADPDRFDVLVKAQAAGILDEIEKFRPGTVILSSEYFFVNIAYARNLDLFAKLSEIASSVMIIAYARRPADWYLSTVQQVLKGSSMLPAPAYRVRHVLDSYEAKFPGAVTVRACEHDQLKDGDIVRDFAAIAAPDALDLLAGHTRRANESLSAEAMSILQEYRARTFPEQDNVFNPQTNSFLQRLIKLDRAAPGFTRPALTPAFEEAVNLGASELGWLLTRYGLRFANIDYGAIAQTIGPSPAGLRVAEICVIDKGRRLALAGQLARSFAGEPGFEKLSLIAASAGED